MWFSKKRPDVSSLRQALPRSELLRRGRVAILDDEVPEMLKDLQDQGLSVDHLSSTSDPRFSRLREAFYDLLLLDYGGIGSGFGGDEGLDVLKFLKRVNPSLRVLAFTARTFDASKADFFRLCDGVVKKDAGIREILELLEAELGKLLTPAFQFEALKRVLNLSAEDEKALEKAMSQAIAGKKSGDHVLAFIKRVAKSETETLAETLVKKGLELGKLALLGFL